MQTPHPEDIQQEIDSLTARMAEIAPLGQSGAIKEVAHKLNHAKELLAVTQGIKRNEQETLDNTELLTSEDADMKALAVEEALRLEQEKSALVTKLEELLIPEDPRNSRDVIMEIRAGAGGEEATLFAQELLRAYIRYAEIKGWNVTALEDGVVEISGHEVYGQLKYESGVHRVQRIPETEKMGRTHTSTVTVAILPRAEEVDIEIKPEDLRIDTYRASGAGGQHVNKTSSAIRITHIPTNTVVACQEERSQHKNREKAMSLLRSRILASREEAIQAKEASARKAQIGTGDRSEKIRTYNYPQDRITDHRIKMSWSNIPSIMEGAMDTMFSDIQKADRELRLKAAV